MPRRIHILLALAAAALVAAPADGAAGASLAETVQTRQRFFGVENVNARTAAVRADRAIFSWFGVTNFALAIRGHVLLLDAWVPRGASSGYVPTTPEELAKLAPEAILIGHAHFDHAADAVPIAQASGAPLVGTGEQCQAFRQRAGAMLPPRCREVVAARTSPGTTTETELMPGLHVTAVRHLHSAGTPPDGADHGGYHVPVVPPLSTTPLEHPPTPQDVAHLVEHAPDAEAGDILYRLRAGGVTFVWHDTSGPLSESAPATFERFRALRPVDVQLGAIQSFNQFTNGLRDVRHYIEALAPRMFVPTHHDDWLTGITAQGSYFEKPLADELARIPPERRPQVRFIEDPRDYIRPQALTFPLQLRGSRIVRRCVRGGRLRAALREELDLVASARYRLGAAARTSRSAAFRVTFSAREVAAARGRRLRAVVTRSDGTTLRTSRSAPRCGRRVAGQRRP